MRQAIIAAVCRQYLFQRRRLIPRPDIDPDENKTLRRHQTSLRNILPVPDPVAVGKLGKRASPLKRPGDACPEDPNRALRPPLGELGGESHRRNVPRRVDHAHLGNVRWPRHQEREAGASGVGLHFTNDVVQPVEKLHPILHDRPHRTRGSGPHSTDYTIDPGARLRCDPAHSGRAQILYRRHIA